MELPEELIERILLGLDALSVARCSMTCKQFARIISGEHFWREYASRCACIRCGMNLRWFPRKLVLDILEQEGFTQTFLRRWFCSTNCWNFWEMHITRNRTTKNKTSKSS